MSFFPAMFCLLELNQAAACFFASPGFANDGISCGRRDLLEMKKCINTHIFRAAHVKKWHPRRLFGSLRHAQCPEFIEGPVLNAAGGRDAVFSNAYEYASEVFFVPPGS
jgi:hypothetical protein